LSVTIGVPMEARGNGRTVGEGAPPRVPDQRGVKSPGRELKIWPRGEP
jgi:hypothetical protein